MSATAFTAPIALIDPTQPQIERRWTAFLPSLVARVTTETKAQVLTDLDALYARLGPDYATDLLPAPQAVTELRTLANRAYDRGFFPRFLALTAQLQRLDFTLGKVQDQRLAIAQHLVSFGPLIDPSLELTAPALGVNAFARARETTAPANEVGITINWQSEPGWLFACDDAGRIWWQHRTSRTATVLTGAGGAVVRDVDGARLLDEQGRLSPLPPLPGEAVSLGLRGGAAWFHTQARVWRLDLRNAAVSEFTLDQSPLGPPFVRGAKSLWLTLDHLLLVEGAQTVARWRLQAAPGWALVDLPPNATGVGLRDSDGRTVAIESLPARLATASPAEQALLFAKAERPADSVNAIAVAHTALNAGGMDQSRREANLRALLAAHLTLGVAQIREQQSALVELATTAHDAQAIVTILATTLPNADADRRLRSVLSAAPELLVPGSPTHAADLNDPSTWNHAIAGRAWLTRDAVSAVRSLAAPGAAQRTLNQQPETTDQPFPIFIASADGGLSGPDRSIHVTRSAGRLAITCTNHAGQLLWRQRWWSLPGVQAPSTTLMARDGVLFVIEGDSRISALDLADGTLAAQCALPDGASTPSDVCLPALGTIALLGPAGVDRTVWIVTTTTDAVRVLPSRALRLRAFDHGRLAAKLSDGTQLTVINAP